jgi:hypothetical protein
MDLLGVAGRFKQPPTEYWKSGASSLHDSFVPFTKLLLRWVMSRGDRGYHSVLHLEQSRSKD